MGFLRCRGNPANPPGEILGLEVTMRKDLIFLFLFLAIWFALQRWILPRLGVDT
jgi:hypothetical protein